MSSGIANIGIKDGWIVKDGGLQDVCLACKFPRSFHPFDRPLVFSDEVERTGIVLTFHCSRGVMRLAAIDGKDT